MTDKNLQMLINVVCIESAPKVLEFTAMFSGLAGALASAMQNFAIEGGTDVDPHAHFDGAFDELIYEVHESIQGQSEYIRKKHNTELAELSQNGVVQQAHAIIERINHALPLLGRLDDILSTKDLLAYVSLKSNNSAHSSLIQDFLQCYASIIDKMEKDQQAEERHKQQQISELYDAIVNNTSDTVVQKIEAGVDLEAQVESSGKTPLALAIAKESADVASALIKLGAEPVKSSEGLSPIHIAANRKNGKLLCTLIASNHTSLDSVNWAELFIRNITVSGIFQGRIL